MLAYNIGNKFDGGGSNYKTCQLATCDNLLGRLKKLVGWLAIREAMAEVVSHSAVSISTAAVSRRVCRGEFQSK